MSDPIRARIEAGGVALGLIARVVRSGEIATIAKSSGHDFLFIDGQHAAYSPETVIHLIQAAHGCGLAALMRVRHPEDPDIPIWLDGGATGIVAPDLVSAAQARGFVERCRFPPAGHRSFGGPLQRYGYAGVDPMTLNRDILCVGMIETKEAVGEIDAIAAVEGLDVLHIGLSDLSHALGVPGEMTASALRDAFAAIADSTARFGKILGVGGDRDLARRRDYMRMGARFLTTDTDINYLLNGAKETVRSLRTHQQD